MQKKTWLRVWVVVTLIRILLAFPLVAGEHELEELSCNNIPEEKLNDCAYILDSDFSEGEKTELLDALNTQSYNYEYNWQSAEEIPQSKIEIHEIDNETLLLAWDIIVLIFFNYFAFSVLTKSSFFAKWLNVAY